MVNQNSREQGASGEFCIQLCFDIGKQMGNLIPQKVSQNTDIPAKKLENRKQARKQAFFQVLTQY